MVQINMPHSLGRLLPSLAIVLGALSFSSAQAQQQAPAPSWVKVCSKIGETDICNVKYDVISSNGQLVTGVNLLQSKGENSRRIFQVAVPSGRYIPEGIKVQIDQGNVNTLPYSLCLPDRCLAEIQLSDALVKAMKAGGEVTLTSTNFRAAKNPVKVSLKGFTAAFDGPPLKRDEVANRQKKLEEELKKKAQETADKLKAAQDAAKSGN
ncbi:MAG: invasion associated locus B family protein [Rhizobiaceae bacterium]